MQALDVIVRVAAVACLLGLAGLLLRDARHERVARFLLPFALGLCGFLAGNTPDPTLSVAGVFGAGAGAVAGMLSGSAALFLWWFCLAAYDDEFRLGRGHVAVGVAWLAVALADRGLLVPGLGGRGLSWLLVGMAAAMVAHVAWRVLRDRAGDLVKARRDGRRPLVAALLALLGTDLAVDVVLGFGWKPQAFTLAQNTAILLLAVHLGRRLLRADAAALAYATPVAARVPVPAPGSGGTMVRAQATPDVPPEPTHGVAGADDGACDAGADAAPAPMAPDARLLARLHALMTVERIHRDPGLTFAAFAARMQAPEPEVRRLVNHHLGARHFRSFLNSYRIAEACEALADPQRAGRKMIAIAHESGFASLASFNRAFRLAMDMSPTDYRGQVPGTPLPAAGVVEADAADDRGDGDGDGDGRGGAGVRPMR